MIDILFGFANEKVLVTIRGNEVYFSSTAFGAQKAPIEGLRLDRSGVMREFPDLEGRDDWADVAVDRFKEKIASFKTENEKADYIIEDLRKFGYTPEKKQKWGFRAKNIE